jgi:hypothetical protein
MRKPTHVTPRKFIILKIKKLGPIIGTPGGSIVHTFKVCSYQSIVESLTNK